jgi:hypothetical protein
VGIGQKRLPIVSGSYNNTSNAGPDALNLNNERSNVNTNIGFFSAYPLSQTGTFTDVSQRMKGKGIYFHSGGHVGKIKVAINAVSNRRRR